MKKTVTERVECAKTSEILVQEKDDITKEILNGDKRRGPLYSIDKRCNQ